MMEVEHEQARSGANNHGNHGNHSNNSPPTSRLDSKAAFAAMLRNSELLKHFVNTFNAVPPVVEKESPERPSETHPRSEPMEITPNSQIQQLAAAEALSKFQFLQNSEHKLHKSSSSYKAHVSPSATVTSNSLSPKLTPKVESPVLDIPVTHQRTPSSRTSPLMSDVTSLPHKSPLPPAAAFLNSPLMTPMSMSHASMATAAALAAQAQMQAQAQIQAQVHMQAQVQAAQVQAAHVQAAQVQAAQVQAAQSLPGLLPTEGLNALSPMVPMWDMYGDPHNQHEKGGSQSAIARALSITSTPRRPRSEKKAIPEDLKDNRYFERRKRNNNAAKKSRDARKSREDEIAIRASFLEKENAILRAQVATLREEANSLRQLLLQKRSRP